MSTLTKTAVEEKQEILENWDFSRLEAYVLKDHPELKDNLPVLLRQYRDYLMLSSLVNKALAVPGEKVDIIWHHHLCLNYDYNLLTKALAGKILRHEPSLDGDDTDNQSGKNLVEASFEVFGKFVFDPSLIDHQNGCSACDGNGCMTCHNGCKTSIKCDGGPCNISCTTGMLG